MPHVLPIVLYNGVERWTATTALTELTEPPAGLDRLQLRLSYLVLDESRYRVEELAQREKNRVVAPEQTNLQQVFTE